MRRIQRTAFAAPLLLAALLLASCRDDDTPTPQATQVATQAATPVASETTSQNAKHGAAQAGRANTRQLASATPATQHRSAPSRARAQPARDPELTGHVIKIEPITEHDSPSGAGAAVGGVIGGVLGNQVGGGNGRTAATVAGVVGGAVLGNHIEKQRSSHIVAYRVQVRTDSGGLREFQRQQVGDLAVGTDVRIEDGGITPA